ncbi:MAG: diguanylate cyclase [Deltaproteobacteria bacterium]|nr:diguanylate cyclase [Deltaproteobacteria bacterium]
MKAKTDADRIAQIITSVLNASRGNFSERLEASGKNDELDRLAAAINQMLENFQDQVSKRERIEQVLELTQFAIDRASIACFWISSDNEITYVNEKACRSLGYTREELQSLAIKDIDPGFPVEVWQKFWQELSRHKVQVFETSHQRKDGTIFPVEITSNYVEFDGKQYSCAFARDITEQKKAEEQIRRLAYYDSLTSLPNRRLYKELLSRALKFAERYRTTFAVLFVDLDNLKKVNDTFGHNMGDMVLKEVADRLEHCLRESDYLARQSKDGSKSTVSRIGGDEFIALVNNLTSQHNAESVSKRILKDLASPYDLNGNEVFISASIGIAMYPEDGNDPEGLLKKADMAMYSAKEKGKNNYQFFSAIEHGQE